MNLLQKIRDGYTTAMEATFFTITLFEKFTHHEVHKIDIKGKHIIDAWVIVLFIWALLKH